MGILLHRIVNSLPSPRATKSFAPMGDKHSAPAPAQWIPFEQLEEVLCAKDARKYVVTAKNGCKLAIHHVSTGHTSARGKYVPIAVYNTDKCDRKVYLRFDASCDDDAIADSVFRMVSASGRQPTWLHGTPASRSQRKRSPSRCPEKPTVHELPLSRV